MLLSSHLYGTLKNYLCRLFWRHRNCCWEWLHNHPLPVLKENKTRKILSHRAPQFSTELVLASQMLLYPSSHFLWNLSKFYNIRTMLVMQVFCCHMLTAQSYSSDCLTLSKKKSRIARHAAPSYACSLGKKPIGVQWDLPSSKQAHNCNLCIFLSLWCRTENRIVFYVFWKVEKSRSYIVNWKTTKFKHVLTNPGIKQLTAKLYSIFCYLSHKNKILFFPTKLISFKA